MANVQVIGIQRSDFLVFGAGSPNRLTIPGFFLTNGDRYLALHKTFVGVSNGCTRAEINIGGVTQVETQGIMCAAATNGQLKQITGMKLFTADGVSNVVAKQTHISGTARTGDEQLMVINLDNVLVENTDWFHDENATGDGTGGGTSFGGEAQPSSLTFTPDGFSDYLVLGHLRFTGGGSSNAEGFRLQDVTNGATLAQTGPGHGNVGTEEHAMLVMGVLQLPAPVPLTLETQYKSSPALTKANAQIFVLRLNKFASRGFVVADIAATPTGSRQSIGSFPFTSDAAGDVMLFASFMAEATPGFESGNGIIGDVEFGGSIVMDLNDSGEHIAPSFNSFGKADAQVGPNFYTELTGQSGTDLVEGFVDSSTPTVDVTLRRMALVALGTEVIVPAPPQVTVRDPLPDAVEQPRSTNIFFSIGGTDGVDIATIDVQLQIGGGGFFQAVQAGVSVFPFDGPQVSVVPVSGGFDITIDNRGVWSVNTLVDVRINADSVSGLSMTQVDYSYATSSEAVAAGVLVQLARD